MTAVRDLLANHLLVFAVLAAVATTVAWTALRVTERRRPKPPAPGPFDCFKPLPRRIVTVEPSRDDADLVVAEAIRITRDSVHH